MDVFLLVKTLHIISATIIFGTGIDIASLMLFGQASPDPRARLFAARTVVRMDMIFTLPAVIVQPLSGALLIHLGGFRWSEGWLVAAYALYTLAGLCWLPVLAIQSRLARIMRTAAEGEPVDEGQRRALLRIWTALGVPAFSSLVIVFWLMVAKPQW